MAFELAHQVLLAGCRIDRGAKNSVHGFSHLVRFFGFFSRTEKKWSNENSSATFIAFYLCGCGKIFSARQNKNNRFFPGGSPSGDPAFRDSQTNMQQGNRNYYMDSPLSRLPNGETVSLYSHGRPSVNLAFVVSMCFVSRQQKVRAYYSGYIGWLLCI